MTHQNFEKYANQRLMDGCVSKQYKVLFNKIIRVLKYQDIKDIKILDYGCGDGRYFNYFKRFIDIENIYGVEISKIRVDRCIKNGWDKVYLIQNDDDDDNISPFKDNFFDVINFDQVIEHISKDKIDFCLSEIKRILKPEGIVILMTPNYPIKRFYDICSGKMKDDPTHVTKYNFKLLNKLLRKYFSVVYIFPTGGMLYRMFKYNLFSRKIIGYCTWKKNG